MVGEGEVTFREVLEQYLREAEMAGQSEQQPESDSTEQQVADRRGTVAGKSVVERFRTDSGIMSCFRLYGTQRPDRSDHIAVPL